MKNSYTKYININMKKKSQIQNIFVLDQIIHSKMSPNTEGIYGPDCKVSEFNAGSFKANMGKY